MKRLWMAVLLLAALLSLCLVNAWYSLTLTQQLSEQLNQAQALVEQDQWEQARSITQEVYHSWNGHHFYLHVFLRHSDTDQILRTFRQVIQYLDLEELDQYVAANADLVAQLELLSEPVLDPGNGEPSQVDSLVLTTAVASTLYKLVTDNLLALQTPPEKETEPSC